MIVQDNPFNNFKKVKIDWVDCDSLSKQNKVIMSLPKQYKLRRKRTNVKSISAKNDNLKMCNNQKIRTLSRDIKTTRAKPEFENKQSLIYNNHSNDDNKILKI